MARAVASTPVVPGGFRTALLHVLDARMAVGLQTGDDALVAALADFRFVRAEGRGSRQSVTTLEPGDEPTEDLRRQILARIFAAPAHRRWRRRCEGEAAGTTEFARPLETGGGRAPWTWRVTADDDGTVRVYHAADGEVPGLLDLLEELWDRVLADPARAGADLARFEWWFIAANVTARGGASIGDGLSLALQRAVGLPLRSGFLRLDWEVLSRPPDDYLRWRTSAPPTP